MTKNLAVLIPMFLMMIVSVKAQPNNQGNKRAEIEAQRIAFLTKKVGFTPEEAKQFWPIDDVYQKEMRAIKKQRRQNNKAMKEGFDTMSDKEIEAKLDKEIQLRRQEFELSEQYHKDLKGVLTPKKIARLYHAEEQFKKILMRQMQNKQGQGGNRGPRR